MSRRAVIGIGNPLRGDDGLGPLVIEALRGSEGLRGGVPADVTCLALDGEATALADALGRYEAVVLIDCAMDEGSPAGTIRRLDPRRESVPADHRPASSHTAGLALALRLAEALGRLSRRLSLFAVTGRTFTVGAPMSPEVAAAARRVLPMIEAELAAWQEAPADA